MTNAFSIRCVATRGIRAFGTALIAVCGLAHAQTWNNPHPAIYAGPMRETTPDQDYAFRRTISDKDRETIARYRSGAVSPVFEARFNNPDDLSDWTLPSRENTKLISCVRPQSTSTTASGLMLQIKPVTDCQAKWSTGQIISKATYKFGYFEASMKIAAIPGVDNAFWLVTRDGYEIDVTETFYPNASTSAVHQWHPPKGRSHTMVSSRISLQKNLSEGFHDYGVLWSEDEVVFSIDGEPYVALKTNGSIKAPAEIHLSNAIVPWGQKPPDNPSGAATLFRRVRVFPPQ
ncbi:glycoside hydrolase family protein [Caballeronia hypogeia]|uniref:Glycoside hydrolase family protein n=1 Tax=Caballeronia hypogeia TaxID=1777140 RepID=A0A158AHH4_9BURK|nr:glycoside hydrolase family 16 protein [Caballeronia hypogeia]SAK56537.1 glycoside hydrolase family protein [Caballeronia hypogeia]